MDSRGNQEEFRRLCIRGTGILTAVGFAIAAAVIPVAPMVVRALGGRRLSHRRSSQPMARGGVHTQSRNRRRHTCRSRIGKDWILSFIPRSSVWSFMCLARPLFLLPNRTRGGRPRDVHRNACLGSPFLRPTVHLVESSSTPNVRAGVLPSRRLTRTESICRLRVRRVLDRPSGAIALDVAGRRSNRRGRSRASLFCYLVRREPTDPVGRVAWAGGIVTERSTASSTAPSSCGKRSKRSG